MNANDFYDWKRHPVTMVIMDAYKARLEHYKEQLVQTAGQDPYQDAVASGAARAYYDILNTTFSDIDEETQ